MSKLDNVNKARLESLIQIDLASDPDITCFVRSDEYGHHAEIVINYYTHQADIKIPKKFIRRVAEALLELTSD
jgi:hypothetical protein